MINLPNIKDENELFIFLLHTIQERFKDNAVLKGGMVLRLLGSKRKTLDLDYTFIPFKSKNDILNQVEELFNEIEGLHFSITTNSKAIRINIEVKKFRSQVEINVAEELKTEVISTVNLKGDDSSVSPRIIRIMDPKVALAHKLGAWNERRLLRDLYDIYYFLEIQNISPDLETLRERLKKINSRRPELRKVKSMDLKLFMMTLKKEIGELSQDKINKELDGLLDIDELVGLHYKIKNTIGVYIESLN